MPALAKLLRRIQSCDSVVFVAFWIRACTSEDSIILTSVLAPKTPTTSEWFPEDSVLYSWIPHSMVRSYSGWTGLLFPDTIVRKHCIWY